MLSLLLAPRSRRRRPSAFYDPPASGVKARLQASHSNDAISQAECGMGELALSCGAFVAARHEDDFEPAVRVAVNHSGDSDSTGSICGNLLGARHGIAGLPGDWLESLEMRGVIEQLARDLVTRIPLEGPVGDLFLERHPGC